MLIHSLQTQFCFIVAKSLISFIQDIQKEYFHVYIIRQSITNILISESSLFILRFQLNRGSLKVSKY